MLKSQKKNSLIINNAIELGELTTEANGKGRKFTSRFIEAGVAHYEQFGDVLITKETLDKFIQTMVGCPVIIKHKDITDKNADKERVGVVSRVWYNEADGWFYCEGVIWDKQAIDLVKNQGWNVSCTYDFESDFKKSTYHGKEIDMEFTGGEFLHLALVPNPRYERATIVMNSQDDTETIFLSGLKTIIENALNTELSEEDRKVINGLSEIFFVENDEKWITIKPHGKDAEDYKRLKLRDGETPKEGMKRVYGVDIGKGKDNKNDEEIKKEIETLKRKQNIVGKDTKMYQIYGGKIKELEDKLNGEETPQEQPKEQPEEQPKENPKDDKEILKQIEDLSEEYWKADKEYWGTSWQDQDKRKEIGERRENLKKQLKEVGTKLSTVGKSWKNTDGKEVTFMGYDADANGFAVKTETSYGHSYSYYSDISSIDKLEKADTEGYKKVQEKENKQAQSTKKLKVGSMPVAKTVQEATKLASEYGLADKINFGKLSVDICNAMNQSANDNLAEFPEIRKYCKEFGSLQGRNKSLIEEAIDIKGESLSIAIRDRLAKEKKKYGENYIAQVYGDEKAIEKKIKSKVEKRVKDILSIGKASGEIAHCKYYPPSQAGIVWNEKFKDSKNFDYTVGFHPEGATSLKAICDHEFGHQIHHYIKENKKPNTSQKYNELMTYYNTLSKDDIKNGLSRYANTNVSEWISEGYAEYKNNPNCRPMAKKIGELLTASYKEVANG